MYSLVIDAASLCIYFWQMIADLEQRCCGILFSPVAKLRGRVHLRLSLLVSEPSAMHSMLFVKYTVPRVSGWLSCPVESPALRSVDLLSEEGSFLARLGYQLGVFWYRCYTHIVKKKKTESILAREQTKIAFNFKGSVSVWMYLSVYWSYYVVAKFSLFDHLNEIKFILSNVPLLTWGNAACVIIVVHTASWFARHWVKRSNTVHPLLLTVFCVSFDAVPLFTRKHSQTLTAHRNAGVCLPGEVKPHFPSAWL